MTERLATTPSSADDARLGVVFVYAAAMMAFVAWLVGANHPEWWGDHGFVYRFQTLIGAGIAIVAALIGGGAVYHQTASNRARERRLDLAKEAATRAILPHLLDALMSYAEACVELLNEVRPHANASRPPSGVTFSPLPTLPLELVDRLGAASEFMGEAPRDLLASVLINLQTQHARMVAWTEPLMKPPAGMFFKFTSLGNVDSAAMDTGALYTRVERLYPYARSKGTASFEGSLRPDVSVAEASRAIDILHYVGVNHADFTFTKLIEQEPDHEWK